MIDTTAILAAVRENLERRKACPRHQFAAQDSYPLGGKLTCSHCGTAMRITEVGLYMRGYQAAGGNPDDILEGWR